MDIDWVRVVLQIALVCGIYYGLVIFTPFARLERRRQFLVFGATGFVALFVFGLVWP